jgi:hypothetical protein
MVPASATYTPWRCGIFDLKLLGTTLRLRWLWLHCTDPTRSWSTLPLKEDSTIQAFLKVSIQCVLGNGKAVLFWTDPWLGDRCFFETMPELAAIVPTHYRQTQTVASVLHNN